MGDNIEASVSITQLPTSILKDFSGNKHNAYLYGFKGKLNSGVGIYAQDFKNWNYGSAINNDISTKSYNKFHIVKKKADNWFGFTIGIPATRPYQDALIQCDIRRVAEHADFNLWRRTCRMISGEVVLPNTPTVTGYASYNPCDCRNNSTQTPAA